MKIIDKSEFAKLILNKNIKAFVIYVAPFSLSFILIYLAQKVEIVLLFIKKVNILAKYLDLINVFLKKLVIKLIKRLNINKYIMT